jgi:ATP/maltotriose-dependent transcriptional regulator MalT
MAEGDPHADPTECGLRRRGRTTQCGIRRHNRSRIRRIRGRLPLHATVVGSDCCSHARDRLYEILRTAGRREFREAFEIGVRVGSHSHAARLADALLGELLYEAGELDEAAHLLEMGYGLGSEGGGVDYLAARYVASAKVKAAQGDLSAAAERLDAGVKAAEHLRLPRLMAAINNERIRLGMSVTPAVAALRSVRSIPRHAGTATITAGLDEESAVRPAVGGRFRRGTGSGRPTCKRAGCKHRCRAKAAGGAARSTAAS